MDRPCVQLLTSKQQLETCGLRTMVSPQVVMINILSHFIYDTNQISCHSQRDHHNTNSDHIVCQHPLAAVHDQYVFPAEDTGMGAQQFWAKWPDLQQWKQDSLGPNPTIRLETVINMRLDMGECCWKVYSCWGPERGLVGFFDSKLSALLSFTARLMRFLSSESHARGSWM